MFSVEQSTEIAYRNDFSLLCNARGIKLAIEVGVEHGVFAAKFLSRWQGDLMFLVDDYAVYPDHPGNRLPDIVAACLAMAPYQGRFRFIGAKSLAAAAWLPAWFKPQFIYIDAGHKYDAVMADLTAWWAQLEPGGILAGHDFTGDHPEVARAVVDFAKANALCVRLTHETPASWYVYKGEPVELMHRFFREGVSPNQHSSGGKA